MFKPRRQEATIANAFTNHDSFWIVPKASVSYCAAVCPAGFVQRFPAEKLNTAHAPPQIEAWVRDYQMGIVCKWGPRSRPRNKTVRREWAEFVSIWNIAARNQPLQPRARTKSRF